MSLSDTRSEAQRSTAACELYQGSGCLMETSPVNQRLFELPLVQIASNSADVRNVQISHMHGPLPDGAEKSLTDAATEIILVSDIAEDAAHGDAITTVWRGCEPQHFGTGEVRHNVAVSPGRCVVGFVNHQRTKAGGIPLLQAPATHRRH